MRGRFIYGADGGENTIYACMEFSLEGFAGKRGGGWEFKGLDCLFVEFCWEVVDGVGVKGNI